jgi:hypothetical protein
VSVFGGKSCERRKSKYSLLCAVVAYLPVEFDMKEQHQNYGNDGDYGNPLQSDPSTCLNKNKSSNFQALLTLTKHQALGESE